MIPNRCLENLDCLIKREKLVFRLFKKVSDARRAQADERRRTACVISLELRLDERNEAVDLFQQPVSSELSVRQYAHVPAAAMLVDDAFAGFFIDFVSLPASFRDIFRRCLVAVAQEDHRLVMGIRPFVELVGRDADNLPLA